MSNTTTQLRELRAVHAETIERIQLITDDALDWAPDATQWSLRQVIGHLAHAYDFYGMIVEQARATNFASVSLHPGLEGWQRMLATDAGVARTRTSHEALAWYEEAYQRLITVLITLTEEELDHPFTFTDPHPNAEPIVTTLRVRVMQMVTTHMREHHGQLIPGSMPQQVISN